jgi:hypothetical protein
MVALRERGPLVMVLGMVAATALARSVEETKLQVKIGLYTVKSTFSIPITTHVPRVLTVRIAGFHPAGPSSTPGVGIILSAFHILE